MKRIEDQNLERRTPGIVTLSRQQLEAHYWQLAIRMFNTAAKEPTYLTTATISLQTALMMDQLLADPPPAADR
jgi:hypothetical protein